MPPAKEQEDGGGGGGPNNVNNTVTPSRRKIKGKTPPPSLSTDIASAVEIATDTDDKDMEELYTRATVGSPSVVRQLEQEQADKWKTDRLVNGVAKMKSDRDKEFSERRQSGSTGTATRETAAVEETVVIPPEKLQEFSVEPKFPEHKRSGDSLTGISEGEPQGKRRKASADDEENAKDKDTIAATTRAVVVTAALAAALAIGFAIFRRSTGRG